MSDETATIEVVPHAPVWFLFARWNLISINIDGELARLRWKTHAFTVAPGEHAVSVGMGVAFGAKAALTVRIAAGETIRLRYTPHLIKNARGKLEIERLPSARIVDR